MKNDEKKDVYERTEKKKKIEERVILKEDA